MAELKQVSDRICVTTAAHFYCRYPPPPHQFKKQHDEKHRSRRSIGTGLRRDGVGPLHICRTGVASLSEQAFLQRSFSPVYAGQTWSADLENHEPMSWRGSTLKVLRTRSSFNKQAVSGIHASWMPTSGFEPAQQGLLYFPLSPWASVSTNFTGADSKLRAAPGSPSQQRRPTLPWRAAFGVSQLKRLSSGPTGTAGW